MALQQVKKCLDETNVLKNILEFAIQSEENYKIVRCQILHREIEIPKMHRACLSKIFKSGTLNKKYLVGQEFHEWLQSFLVTGENPSDIPQLNYNESNYFVLANFLKSGSLLLKNKKQNLLIHECHYGYFLELFYQAHSDRTLRGTINQKFSEVIKEEFKISDRYGRQLRWLGRLWHQFPKIQNLSISLYRLHSHKKEFENFFSHPTLAKEWK